MRTSSRVSCFSIGTALLVLSVLPGCGREPIESRRWNVLLVTLDTTRADALGCYGAPGSPTPNLDRLAAVGTRFETAICTAALTPVSHASILTGCDNSEHGLRVLAGRGGYRLSPAVPSLATILRENGYSTSAVQSAFPVSAYFGFDHGFDRFDSLESSLVEGSAGGLAWDVPGLQRRSDEATDRALATLSQLDDPFFLWVHYWDPHDNARVPPPNALAASVPRDAEGRCLPGRALYAAEVRYMDEQLGRLFSALKQSGAWEHTLVVVVSDHGEGLGDHEWRAHRILYQEQIRVPLIVRVPGQRASVVSQLVRTTDIAPSILDYLALRSPRSMSGRSLRQLMNGQVDIPRVAFADALNGYDLNVSTIPRNPAEDFVYAVVDHPWKLLYRPLHPDHDELFHLGRDPAERENRIESEPAVVLRLQKLLAAHGGWVTAPFASVDGVKVDSASARRALQQLGYAGDGVPRLDGRFAYACPEHRLEVSDAPIPCSSCGAPRLAVARPP